MGRAPSSLTRAKSWCCARLQTYLNVEMMGRNRLLYFTFGESYSGIYRSQVVDVVRHLNAEFDVDVGLLAILPMKLWSAQRKLIGRDFPGAAVLSALPFQGRHFLWRWHIIPLALYVLFTRRRRLICRGAFATRLALDLRKIGLVKSVVYDGRGAMAAEQREYNIYSRHIADRIEPLERQAVLRADHRIAVTDALADYWTRCYDFNASYSRIPCTLSTSWQRDHPVWEEARRAVRETMGLAESDVLLMYSGSAAGWQSFGLLLGELDRALESDLRFHVLLLCPETVEIVQFLDRWPGRTRRMFVSPSEVVNWISAADVGLILRESSVTNSVAMPTKFAEFLAAGLHLVLTGPNPAAEYAVANEVGTRWSEGFDWSNWLKIKMQEGHKLDIDSRSRSRNCAYRDFLKTSQSNREGYFKVLGDAVVN